MTWSDVPRLYWLAMGIAISAVVSATVSTTITTITIVSTATAIIISPISFRN